MNKPVFCDYCAKTHLLSPGEWEDEDKQALKEIQQHAREDDDFTAICDNLTIPLSEEAVQFMAMVDRFTGPQREIYKL